MKENHLFPFQESLRSMRVVQYSIVDTKCQLLKVRYDQIRFFWPRQVLPRANTLNILSFMPFSISVLKLLGIVSSRHFPKLDVQHF